MKEGKEKESTGEPSQVDFSTFGFAHHAERRRTREQDLADQLKELDEEVQVAEIKEETSAEDLIAQVAEEVAAAAAGEVDVPAEAEKTPPTT